MSPAPHRLSIHRLPVARSRARDRHRQHPGLTWFLILLAGVLTCSSFTAAAQPYTTTLVNHTAATSITCNACTLSPSPCMPGQTCSAVGWGFNTFMAGTTQLRWHSVARDGVTAQWKTGTNLYHNLYDTLIVDAYDVVATEYVWLSQNAFLLKEDGGSVRITVKREGAISSDPTKVTIDLCHHAPISPTDLCGSTATLSSADPPDGDFTQSGATAEWDSGLQRNVYVVTIPANQNSATLVLTSVDDAIVEPDEVIYFRVTSVDACGWYNEPTPLSVKIDDDDRKVTLTVSSLAISEGETTTVTAHVTPPNPDEGVIVALTWGGTTTRPWDFYTTSTAISVPAGAASAAITIGPYRDCTVETEETIELDMVGASNASESGTQQATITIADTPASGTCPQLQSLTIDNSSIAENGTAIVTATLSRGDAGIPITISLGFSGTAGESDYAAETSITIPSGTTGSATLTAAQDFLDEDDETLTVSVIAVENAVVGGTHEVSTTIVDDDARPVVTPAQSFSIPENSVVATTVGNVIATDADAGTILQGWTISNNTDPDGDSVDAFAIDATTGRLTVSDPGDLDYETKPSLAIQVSVSDGTNSSAPADVVVLLLDVGEGEGPCSGRTAGTVCRAAAGLCDVEETCDGTSSDCPADGFVSPFVVCRAAAGPCDLAEECTGVSALCPPDAKSLEVCRESDGACDVEEVCDGIGNDCPADQLLPQATVCRFAHGECDLEEVCTGASARCPDDLKSQAVCREAAGDCDIAETCDGVSDACPEDELVAARMICRDSAGKCDLPEFCDGENPMCPADAKSEEICREKAGDCDLDERCDGVSNDCPADAFRGEATLCRPARGDCDLEEQCTGESPLCPDDRKSVDVCRPAQEACDSSEVCDGISNDCPADQLLAAGTTCREAYGACDKPEVCSGESASCPEDAFVGADEVCREALGECDSEERCTGSSPKCPADAFTAAGQLCGATVALGVCDEPDTCDGSGNCRENWLPSTTVCRSAAGECDVAESCSGNAADCPEDTFRPAGTACGSALENACTEADTCDESGACDPNNLECASITNSSLCRFAEGNCGAGGAPVFRMLYTPDVKEWPAYKLNATNPGQFSYNLIRQGTPGSDVTIAIEVPYPFVTQGTMSVLVQDASLLRFDTAGCFVAPAAVLNAFDVRLTMDDWIRGALGPNHGRYNLNCRSTGGPVDSNPAICTFDLTLKLPPSGEVFVRTHLDYGLKGNSVDANPPDLLADRYDAGAADADGRDALVNTSSNAGMIGVRNCEEYEFAHASGSASFVTATRGLNDFKKIAGVFGLVLRSSTGEGVAGIAIRLVLKRTGAVVGTATTDRDGYYVVPYKHKGKSDLYIVSLSDGRLRQELELNANGWGEVSFDLSTGTTFGEFGTGSKTK